MRYLRRTCGVVQCCSNGLGLACTVELDVAQCRFDGLGLAQAVELQVEHDVARIVGGAQDTVASHARALPADRIAVEGYLPGVVVRYWVFDAQDVHLLGPSPRSCPAHIVHALCPGPIGQERPWRWTGAMQTSENTSSETVWKIGWAPKKVSEAATKGHK